MLQTQDAWQAPGKPLSYARQPLLMTLLTEAGQRRKVEAEWALSLRDEGIEAVPSYAPLPDVSQVNVAALKDLHLSHGIDLLIVAGVSLGAEAGRSLHHDLATHLDYHVNLAFDVFVHQVELAVVNVAAFSLHDETLLWRTVYWVPVKDGQVDWPLVVRSANKEIFAAGLMTHPKAKDAENAPLAEP